jgi:hypothetical protein
MTEQERAAKLVACTKAFLELAKQSGELQNYV